jgi:hypothetical protein
VTPREPIRARWTSRLHGDPAEQAAAGLLEQANPPALLTPAALDRLRARVLADAEAGGRSRRRRAIGLGGLFALMGGAALAALAMNRMHPQARRTAAAARQRQYSAARCALAHIATVPSAQVALIGPGNATISDDAPDQVLLGEGRLLVRTQATPVEVQTPSGGGRVRVEVGGIAEIEITSRRGVRVAAFAARAVVTTARAEIVVPAGQVWSDNVLSPAAPGRARQLVPLLAEQADAAEPGCGPGAPDREAPAPAPPPAAAGPAVVRRRPPPPVGDLAQESALLERAVGRLRRDGDADGALAVLSSYENTFPRGRLQTEVIFLRTDALLALGRDREALERLDATPLGITSGDRRLRLVRAELRAAASRFRQAVDDFGAVLTAPAVDQDTEERALYGRASCYTRLGEAALADADLASYLERFPAGRFAREVRAARGGGRR